MKEEELKLLKKRLQWLETKRANTKHKEKEMIRKVLLEHYNSSYFQPIQHFRKKYPQYTRLEEKALGRVTALKLRTSTVSKRDFLPKISKIKYHN